ncbi:type I-E CRISPR-associated protein Cas6/Cse3/CasE [Streptomyces clavuligerus]|uniref:type I-E CRISPR-associated protein Cas6/Cse3/CasE n=1 Tax=Streptomyces clavuligerus TaxID=1901 RepID=UPI00020D926F|nr:type I-E CRISPR-associated protein Cas6/Cse3/CasE [Streptomyces clavuligerus]WDN55953.1 type I-E CRISPR-associated protein Cas6/Cse3/CasE [Streptomyces clavuligerus]
MTLTTPGFTAWRSAITLSPATAHACRDIHRLHQLALHGFRAPGVPVDGPPPPHVLHAAPRTPDHPCPRLGGRVLVQSPRPPDWQPLLTTRRLTAASVFPVTHTYTAGEPVDLRLTANPTRRSRATGRRTHLTDPDDCHAWLHRQLDHHGLTPHPQHTTTGPLLWITGTTSTGNPLQLAIRDFHAHATVRDPDLFHHALTTGIGPGKPYGCGLLLTRTPPHPLH